MKDWKREAIIYQIFPDRFSIGMGSSVYEKINKYSLKGQKVEPWDFKPTHTKSGNHQYRFTGGDLRGIINKLDYIKELGVNTIYLTPIFFAHTNHKYDTIDYFTIDPAFGSEDDFVELCKRVHDENMKIIIDGVFNHMGAASKWFNKNKFFKGGAYSDTGSQYRDFFTFSNNHDYLGWSDSKNLPELKLENEKLREILFTGEDSVIKKWIKLGADGWRLDVAFDVGPEFLKEISDSAKEVKKDAVIIGEIWNFPGSWNKKAKIDGLMNYSFKFLVEDIIKRKITAQTGSKIFADMVGKCDLDYLQRSWNMLSSHDVPRLSGIFSNEKEIALAIFMQYVFPGNPMIYYGEELEMKGGDDPENRAPMDWNKVDDKKDRYYLYKNLNKIKKENRALSYGNFEILHNDSKNVMVFKRFTNKIDDLLIAVVNFRDKKESIKFYADEEFLMNGTTFKDLFTSREFMSQIGGLEIELKPYEYFILKPQIDRSKAGYTPYKRV
ncbi:MAG: cyclomaltodextrinase / maltogenic alpha-amylase / neopullulanase [Kosmotogales bacterium]|nr:cyclomaltodextrinase / maltogenic alpha-amylase / neopullulanase [Kosmotogales bacterium]